MLAAIVLNTENNNYWYYHLDFSRVQSFKTLVWIVSEGWGGGVYLSQCVLTVIYMVKLVINSIIST